MQIKVIYDSSIITLEISDPAMAIGHVQLEGLMILPILIKTDPQLTNYLKLWLINLAIKLIKACIPNYIFNCTHNYVCSRLSCAFTCFDSSLTFH